MKERLICVHGHFYQPPRENPWLEAIERQDGAQPFHDWNEKINAECYAPNAASRILDDRDRILRIVNNYARISFNFGPTLLAWLQDRAPEVYAAVLAADTASQKAFSGHGSAMAQAYNHAIMPLMPRRDKVTQVLWGLRDFESRFGRKPEGLWLPETAVDLETLDVLAEMGVKFTILSQRQAKRWRKLGSSAWTEAAEAAIDPTVAYEQRLPSGRKIALFFYNDEISRAVAFEGLLNSGERLAARLMGAFAPEHGGPQLVHIATDGETYGHHHRHGDMALSYALHSIETRGLARLTNYGEFLEKHPPAREVEIVENSSWSCAHGVERWKADCGCSSGAHGSWRQAWRKPLRAALDALRDEAEPQFEREARKLLKDPWAAREAYISVILDRSAKSVDRFLKNHGRSELKGDERARALKLCELSRQLQLMYTSCGWFFDDISGIETVQVLRYAGRAVQLSAELFGARLEPAFLSRLEGAPSNLPEFGTGRGVYEKLVAPQVLDLQGVGAHYAISSLFQSHGKSARLYCYEVERRDYKLLASGQARLGLGRAVVRSLLSEESVDLVFGVLHPKDHALTGVIRPFSEFKGEPACRKWLKDAETAFLKSAPEDVPGAVAACLGPGTYSFDKLFRDEQRRIMEIVLESAMAPAESLLLKLHEQHSPAMRFLSEMRIPLPQVFRAVAEFSLNAAFRKAVERKEPDPEKVRALFEEIRAAGVRLDPVSAAAALKGSLERAARELAGNPEDARALERLRCWVELARSLPLAVPLDSVQNTYYALLQSVLPRMRKAAAGDPAARDWAARFASLAENLSIRVD